MSEVLMEEISLKSTDLQLLVSGVNFGKVSSVVGVWAGWTGSKAAGEEDTLFLVSDEKKRMGHLNFCYKWAFLDSDQQAGE